MRDAPDADPAEIRPENDPEDRAEARTGALAERTASKGAGRKANRLAGETSAYLRQHMQSRRLVSVGRGGARARAREDRPLLVSIGYSACHWCHVMERESFEDAGDRRAA